MLMVKLHVICTALLRDKQVVVLINVLEGTTVPPPTYVLHSQCLKLHSRK
jgi:hypothetical protein